MLFTLLFCCLFSSFVFGQAPSTTKSSLPVFKELGTNPTHPLLLYIPNTALAHSFQSELPPVKGQYLDDPVQLQAIQETWRGQGTPSSLPYYCTPTKEYLWYQADTLATSVKYHGKCEAYAIDESTTFVTLQKGITGQGWKPMLVKTHSPSSFKEAIQLYKKLQKEKKILVIEKTRWMDYEGYLPIYYSVELEAKKEVPKELLELINSLDEKQWELGKPIHTNSSSDWNTKDATVYLYCSKKMETAFRKLQEEQWTPGKWVSYNKASYNRLDFTFKSYWKE